MITNETLSRPTVLLTFLHRIKKKNTCNFKIINTKMFKGATFLSKYFDLFGLVFSFLWICSVYQTAYIDIIEFIILMTKGKTLFLLFNFLSHRLA